MIRIGFIKIDKKKIPLWLNHYEKIPLFSFSTNNLNNSELDKIVKELTKRKIIANKLSLITIWLFKKRKYMFKYKVGTIDKLEGLVKFDKDLKRKLIIEGLK